MGSERLLTGEMAKLRRSVSEALWGMCAADSMSMPVHWYYNINDIRRDFGGWISGFNTPRTRHPSSILSLSNTGEFDQIFGKMPPIISMTFSPSVFQPAAAGRPGPRPNSATWWVMSSSTTN